MNITYWIISLIAYGFIWGLHEDMAGGPYHSLGLVIVWPVASVLIAIPSLMGIHISAFGQSTLQRISIFVFATATVPSLFLMKHFGLTEIFVAHFASLVQGIVYWGNETKGPSVSIDDEGGG